jgi:hypothetical protein
MMAAV